MRWWRSREERAPPRPTDGQERDAFVSVRFSSAALAQALDSSPVISFTFQDASRSSIGPIARALSRPRLRAQKLVESERKHRRSRRNWIEKMRVLIFLFASSSPLLTSATTPPPCSSSARASRPWPRSSSARGRRRAPCRERRARLERRASWPWLRYKRGWGDRGARKKKTDKTRSKRWSERRGERVESKRRSSLLRLRLAARKRKKLNLDLSDFFSLFLFSFIVSLFHFLRVLG